MSKNFKKLISYVSTGNIEKLKETDITTLKTGNIYGSTLLHFIALSSLNYRVDNNEDVIIFLIRGVGIDINQRDNFGATALFYAAARMDPVVLEILIKYGANLDYADKRGKTPLMQAICHRRVHNVDVLLYYGADVTATTHRGYNIFHFSTIYGFGPSFVDRIDKKYHYLLDQQTKSGYSLRKRNLKRE